MTRLVTQSNPRTNHSRPVPVSTALEHDFPAGAVSLTAQAESWRKEIHRPASHTHKWWAQRLGTVFRSILIAAYSENSEEVLYRLNSGFDLTGAKVLDPFAGSGTTLVEAQKLGAACTGVDINPVAGLVQRQSLRRWDERVLARMMAAVEEACRDEIDELHIDRAGDPVLYYFWVAQAKCPECLESTDLFSDYVFARHAYPRRYPEAQALCSQCGAIEMVDLRRSSRGQCRNGHSMDRPAPVNRSSMTCRGGHVTRIIDALDGSPPQYRMYAKLVQHDDKKSYKEVDLFDLELYEEAARRLSLADDRQIITPVGHLEDGYNTIQAKRWGFNTWKQFFNARQMYSLGLLGAAVRDLEESAEREALCTLFSGTLEFNNLFCSYKGEGTGAVRHMFSHHILRPERTPLEAHPWGTPKSSGSFSTLFRSRILRAHAYKADPHDIVINGSGTERRHGISRPVGSVPQSWEVIVGDAGCLPHDDETFDLVVTDPPYFNNVHYSELADFFHAWLRAIQPFSEYDSYATSTRSCLEVQNARADLFGDALARVFKESARVLRRAGLMVFSFHHGTLEAWKEVMRALREAGLIVVSVQPVKAEMSTSSTKSGSKEPNDLDSLVICRRVEATTNGQLRLPRTADEAANLGEARLRCLDEQGISVGIGDVRSVVAGSVLALTTDPTTSIGPDELSAVAAELVGSSCHRWFQ